MNSGGTDMKTTDERVGEFLIFLFVVLFLATVVIFCGPIIIFTLIFALVIRLFINNRISTFIAITSLIFLVISIKIWGALPLIQFSSWWKGIKHLDSLLRVVENKIQGGLPFTVTYKSYIMALLVSIILSKIAIVLLNRLGITFFTKEKEQKLDNYKKSSKYKQIYSSKEKHLKKIQNNYRKSSKNVVCLGMDIYKKTVNFSTKDLFTHGIVQGTTGTGKTYMMYNIMEEALKENLGVIFVDGKGDPKTEKEITRLANFYGKKVYVFSDRSKWHYNPVKYGKATAIKDRLMAVMDWSEQYYKNESENTLQQIILFIQDYIKLEAETGHRTTQGAPLKNDLKTYMRFLNLSEIANYLFQEQSYFIVGKATEGLTETFDTEHKNYFDIPKDNENTKLCKKYIKMFFNQEQLTVEDVENIEEDNKEKNKLIRGLRTQLELLLYSDLGNKFDEKEGETLDIQKIISQGDVVLFSLDSNNYDSFIETIGRFIISDCAYITTELYGNTDNFNGVLGVFDEFGSYGNDKIVSILSKARSAKMGAILGIQSISDLQNKAKDIDIKEQTIDNCNLFILGRTNSPKNTEEIAGLIGTYKDIDRTVMTENQGGKFLRFETQGERGTVRKVNKFKFSPDEIKELPNYQFYYVNKNIEEDNSKKVFARNVFEGL